MKPIAFKDRVTAHVYAGNGGDGCCSFRREKFVDRGGPDGGDGGRGGSVHLVASKDVDSLVGLYYEPHRRAGHGGRGRGKQMTGAHGKDLRVPVPCGTVARIEESGDVLGEVLQDGDELLVAKGGRGGRGNMQFATSTHQAPREFTKGTEGEVRRLVLELKLVADVGLVGYPNAGKSTLLAAVSHAHPKIAAYPFTTINPIIGTLSFEDYTSVRIADIPGLIEGAHEGVGLGHDFLRHVERSSFLLYVLDMAGVDGRDPVKDYRNLRRELKLYNEDLLRRPALTVANKMDLPEAAPNLKAFVKATRQKPLPISAESGLGMDALKQALYEWRRGLRAFDPAGP
jgi:GTP-binding protein